MSYKLIEKIFSVKNKDYHKILTFLGIKFKFYNSNNILKSIYKSNLENNYLNSNFREEIQRRTKLMEEYLFYIKHEIPSIKTHIHAININRPLEKFKNIFNGREVVLVATGPTSKDFKPIKDAIYVGVNGAIYNEQIKLDYIFVQDYTINQGANSIYNPNNNLLNTNINNYEGNNCIKFYGILPPIRVAEIEPEILRIPQSFSYKNNIYQYVLDDRMFNGWAYDIANMPFGDYAGTAFSALQFILYANPTKLYLVGCDCSGRYANDQLHSWKMFKTFASNNNPDLEIISINPVGLKGLFNDKYNNC